MTCNLTQNGTWREDMMPTKNPAGMSLHPAIYYTSKVLELLVQPR